MNLLSLKFWFSLQPVPLLPVYEFILLAIFAFLVVASIVLKIVFSNKKFGSRLARRITRLRLMFLTMGIIGLVFLFFTYERAFVLGARFWFLVWGVGFLVWLGILLYDLFKKMPIELKNCDKQDHYEKYLPKPRR
ncbi:MAG: hypothetical protein U9P90_01860 [Patescibacteria group bacterium]|nr:hypothetical protein [Patescibacteria group bacterium]